MGSLNAADTVAASKEITGSIDSALRWHLLSNHEPPVPQHMLPICRKAIERVNAGSKTKIRLPEGTTYRGSSLVAPWDVVDSLNLESFIDREEA